MKSTDVDWKTGRVEYWELDFLDPAKPLSDHRLDDFDGDLAQVGFAGDVVVDVGWHPMLSRDGTFVVRVI